MSPSGSHDTRNGNTSSPVSSAPELPRNSALPLSNATYSTSRPSGVNTGLFSEFADHVSGESGSVAMTRLPPAASMTSMRSVSTQQAMLRPSGDHDGMNSSLVPEL